MKTTLAIMLAGVLTAAAQRPAIIYTNDAGERVVSFTNLDGQKFIAVTLRKPTARGVVWAQVDREGAITGGGTIPYTNLHPAILKLFKIEPVEAPAKAVQPAVPIQAAVPLKWEEVRVGSVNQLAGYAKCETSKGTMLIKGLPDRAARWCGAWEQHMADLSAASAREDQLNTANAVTPSYVAGDPAWVQAQARQMNAVAVASVAFHRDVAAIKAQGDELLRTQIASCTVTAAFTGRQYAGLPIWICK